MNNVTELFAPPIGSEVFAKIDNQPFYGSESLSLKFLESMRKSSHSKPLYNTIEKLVANGTLVPCWLNKSILKLVIFRMTAPDSAKNGVAFFIPKYKKIYILIDNNINNWGFASNDWISTITIHEMCHLLAKTKPSAFVSAYTPILKEYYGNLFKRIFQLNIVPDVSKFIKFLFKKFEFTANTNLYNLNKYYEYVMEWKELSSFNSEDYQSMAMLLINCIKIRHINFSAWYTNMSKFSAILGPMRQAYIDVIGEAFNGVNTNVFQELDVPSEVIAVISEVKNKYTSKVYQGLKKL